jgi:hypothetical protein
LRGLFIVYFAAQLIVDIVLGWDLTRGTLGSWRGYGMGHIRLSQGGLLALTLSGAGVLFALGLWLFQQLLRRKNWARVVLLIVGWLTAIDAPLSLLFTSRATGLTPWLINLAPGLDWQRVLLVDRVKDLLGLLFWGYLIYVLQINAEVKRDFLEPPQASGPGTAGPTG